MNQGVQQHYGQYEFNDAENAVINKTGGWVNAWGMIQLILGVLAAIGAALTIVAGLVAVGRTSAPLIAGLSYVGYAGFLLFLGVNFRRAGGAFDRVVRTQGNDIPNMMQALDSVGKALKAQVIFTTVAAVLGVLAGIAVGVGATASVVAH